MKKISITFFTFFLLSGAYAQFANFESLGDKAFKNKDYFLSAYYYKMVADAIYAPKGKIPFYTSGKLSKEKIKARSTYIFFQLAESYRLNQNYRDAGEYYLKILEENHEPEYPLSRLWYGICLRANSNFNESIKQLNLFISASKGGSPFIDLATREISNCNFALAQYHSSSPIAVTKMNDRLNAEGGNYALVKNSCGYWFTSSRGTGVDKKHLNNIYTATLIDSLAPTLIKFSNSDNKSSMEFGTPAVDIAHKKIYLTGWYKEDGKTNLAIYYSNLVNNTWSVVTKLNSHVNAEGYNSLQPFVTPDGKRLFFVSDKPGGQGGQDIWVSDLDSIGSPINSVNMGKTINSSFDEQAPFYDTAHRRLVYSSKGFTGLGGFDFFESYHDGDQWSVPANLGYPSNSAKDDLYYYADPNDVNKIYISSDRESECCLHLFSLAIKPQLITGKIVDCDSLKTLVGIKVSLVDSVSKEILKQTVTSTDVGYTFRVTSIHPLKLVFEAPGYFTKVISAKVNTLNDTLYTPNVCLQAFKINTPIVIKNIFYDFNKADLRPASKTALDNLVKIMKDNPRITIELASHTDSIGGDNYNLNLSMQRAQSCVNYIVANGIDKKRLYAKGYGETKPIAPNSLPGGKDDPDGRQLNRRTEFIVLLKD